MHCTSCTNISLVWVNKLNWIEHRLLISVWCFYILKSEQPTLSYMTKKTYSWLLNWSVQIFPECERKQSASSKRYITEWTLSTLKTNYILNAILT